MEDNKTGARAPVAVRSLPRWMIALRVVALLLVLPLVALGVLIMFGNVLGGARHANVGGAALVLLALGALAIAGPLAVFAPRRWPTHAAWHGLGAAGMLVSTLIATPTVWNEMVAPMRLHRQFDRVAAMARMESLNTEPLLVGGVAVGLRTRVVIRLAEAAPLDRVGATLLAMLDGPHLRTNVGALPFDQRAIRSTVIFDGKTLDIGALAALAKRGAAATTQPAPTLRAGDYTVLFDTWHWGLDARHGQSEPCRAERERWASVLPALAQAREVTLHVHAVAALEPIGVYGRRAVELQSPPQPYRYDHAAWLQQLDALPIQTCAERDERERRKQAEAGARRKIDDYLAGRIDWAANPLRKAVCAHNVAAMREVLKLGRPEFNLSGLVSECGIDARQPEIFDTLLPMLHVRQAEREGYCEVAYTWLARRDEASMERLHALGLPVVCARHRHLVKVLRGASEAGQGVPWLRTLVRLGMDPCLQTPSGVTLLQKAAAGAAPEQIEFLLDAGCDPGVLPVPGAIESGPPFASARLGWLLRVRGFFYRDHEMRPPPLPADAAARISKRLGDVTDEELQRVHPQSGVTGALLIAAQKGPGWHADGNAELIAWLGSRGVRMDAADEAGFSWYYRGHTVQTGQPMKDHRVLDGLSDLQLRQLLAPVNLATGRAGQPLDASKDMSAGGLGEYLCRRGAIKC